MTNLERARLWSYSVANDPRHRPQTLDRPATTVRREWARWPQEAHLLDAEKAQYRRLSVAEIARIQGFDPEWVNVPGVSDRDQIAALGNAVPPPLASALGRAIGAGWSFSDTRSVEICAGIGGLAFASAGAGLEPFALVEYWPPACAILRHQTAWPEARVICEDVRSFDYTKYQGIGMISGGPPCQPWSHSGHGRGERDSRDLLSFIPNILQQCSPETFLIENVPGLYTNPAHRDYLEDLTRRLAQPASDLDYGVAIGIFSSADFGVPQVRRRLFIIGFRDKTAAFATQILQRVGDLATHCDPSQPIAGKKSWVTLREAFQNMDDPGGWKTLPKCDQSQGARTPAPQEAVVPPGRIELSWPGKGCIPRVVNGLWQLETPDKSVLFRPLLRCDPEDTPGTEDAAAFVIHGDAINALDALRPLSRGRIDLVYHEANRTDSLARESRYPTYTNSIWLSILRESSARARHLLKPKGFYALQVDDKSYHYARSCLDEEFGPDNYVCTIVWQKKYGPQNDLNVPTAAQEYIIVYSVTPANSLPVIGFRVSDDLIDDGDPRGKWIAGHKGAKSGTEETKFEVNAPPYRWKIVSGELPPGLWQLNKYSGVIWGIPKEAGHYNVKTEAMDASGNRATVMLSFDIAHSGTVERASKVPWLIKGDFDFESGKKLKIFGPSSFHGVVNEEFSVTLNAKGGTPYNFGKAKVGKPGQGRYWEFAQRTLVDAILRDCVSFGSTGVALPSIKKYHSPEGRIARVTTWWDYEDNGKSEDASRHLNEMLRHGLITTAALVAKPEKLMLNLLNLLAPDTSARVLCFGDPAAAMASVCLKTGRLPFVLTGSEHNSLRIWNECGRPRIDSVLAGKDAGGVSSEVPADGHSRGGVLELEVGEPLFEQDIEDGFLSPNTSDYPTDTERLLEGLFSLAGYVMDPVFERTAHNLDGSQCHILAPGQSLDAASLASFEERLGRGSVTVLYESTSVDGDQLSESKLRLLRYPEDLARSSM